ncbi:hypothetical protein BD324DRAFT_47823 [Kockovaella imperatae]|uniref:Uncharacterized protein n=1 Tax=Kockovaella imperatae TaxID=4999 RepID=A0A1Y1UUP1_9TREE|nr:hypothetical protein BD324DRAFT_47823 [Kockovaella imperatae]ORX41186.1 hypothetical protein BD324DRAFT_47823 [Kockovaella imperatae]
MAPTWKGDKIDLPAPSPSRAGPSLTSPIRDDGRSPRLRSSPILLHPLPPSSNLEQIGLAQSELELDKQIRDHEREKALREALQDQEWEIQRLKAKEEVGSMSTRRANAAKSTENRVTRGFERPPQAYELYSAMDRHDIDFIMRVRDHAFSLLLQKSAGEFPIVYASRLGDGHRDIVILLVGAMSRYVNNLEGADFDKKETRNILKALRSNLKLAIDQALLPASSTPSLLSSYLQVLIMSEGDSFLFRTITDLSLLLRDPSSTPVKAAEETVRSFCTKELRGVQGGVSGVEEYIANASLDLIIMSVWSLVAAQLDVERLPTYTFARDLRTWSLLKESRDKNESKLVKLNARTRSLLGKIYELGGDTRKSIQGRLKDVRDSIDRGF